MEVANRWRVAYEKVRTLQSCLPSRAKRVQQLDGGFFENFGSLLREHRAMARTCEEQEEEEKVEEAQEVAVLDDSDSDQELGPAGKSELISTAMGWNIDELYAELLYEIVNVVGCEASTGEERAALLRYLQEAFKVDDDKHRELLERAQAKEAPNIMVNVEVIEARDLAPKDANGLCDPFCTLYLTSANTHRYNTSVKSATLNPVWEEHFSLPVEEPSRDVLVVEVWDFDPAETVREKMSKFSDVKGVKGLRKLMKEIAVTASTGKHDNEMVGSAQMPLRNVPATGTTYWCGLEKKHKSKRQGELKVRMTFGSEKNQQVAMQEHRSLLRVVLLHELDRSKDYSDDEDGSCESCDGLIPSHPKESQLVEPYHWDGSFSLPGETLVTQHRVQCGMSAPSAALARWVEFAGVHSEHPLSFAVFPPLLERLAKALHKDEDKLFWETAKKLMPSCMNAIRKIRKLTPSDKHTLLQLSSVLSILSHLSALKPPEGFDLFPKSVFGWLDTPEDQPNCDIYGTVAAAVRQGAEDWFCSAASTNNVESANDESALSGLIKLVQLVRCDLQRAIDFHDKLFFTTLRFSYAATLFSVYEVKIAEMAKEVVMDVCKTLRPLKFNERPEDGIYDNEPITMGTTLFELYLDLQRFVALGAGLGPGSQEGTAVHNFHTWFHRGVAQWLDIALYKALQRIEKAVELDQLVPIDTSVKYSSSAVDTLSIFYQIKIFWDQLSWPDIEGSYTFVAKIIDDICRCSVFYADKMSKRVEGMGETENVYEKKFQVTTEWCLAINNIEYVRQSIVPFAKELGMERILRALEEFRNEAAAEHCRDTLQLVIDNAVDTVGNKIVELLDTVADKMTPSISRFLLEGAELLNQDCNTVDRLMKYLDDNLVTLHDHLSVDNFDRILAIVWEKLADILYEIVEANLEKRRPPSFFAGLHETLKILVGFFRQGDECDSAGQDSEVLRRIQHLLMVHGLETGELVLQYFLERLPCQDDPDTPSLGLLTVRLQLVEDTLRVEVMSARNIRAMDSNGACDPYVKIHLLPEEKFADVASLRTKTHKKTLFPLFDETFTIRLSEEQRNLENGLVQFIVKDQDFLGMSNEFIGEAFVPLRSIPHTDATTGLEELEQVHLKLHRPACLGSETYRALDHRQGDKLARDFVKKEKSKMIYKDPIVPAK
ncbi:protein unc-13 homolog 4B isoform X3 [Bacillus rossius redtenbacheri]|uniref:protein unc-13 homolog 4B isoform X3 n=1 Tax=Bacillus rossius redtenbacheri TaxID=93214 RepID=UPI002FDDB689